MLIVDLNSGGSRSVCLGRSNIILLLLLSEVEDALANVFSRSCSEASHFRYICPETFTILSNCCCCASWINDKGHFTTVSLEVIWADQLGSISLFIGSSPCLSN